MARNGHDDPNVTSLEEARRRAAQKAKDKSQQMGTAGTRGPRTARDWIFGGAIIAMAVGFVVWLVMTATQSIGGGGQ